MRTKEITIKNLMSESSVINQKGLSEDDVKSIIEDYQKSVNRTLLENGYVQISDNFKLEIVKIKKRVHVLRGQSYYNHRKYKLKVTTNYDYYEKIAESFESLLGDDF